jgi:hypothetical protein
VNSAAIAADLKRTSVLRRVPPFGTVRFLEAAALEGDVCGFEMPSQSSPILVEAVNGRAIALAPGDIFLAAPGYRESTRWVVGGIPDGGLVPGGVYWVLADCGIIGDLIGDSPREKGHLGQVRCIGPVADDDANIVNIRQFAIHPKDSAADHQAPLYLVLGTSAEVGKTTAGIAIIRALRHKGRANIVALKATGTSSLSEISVYQDFGAVQVFDCVDFGVPTTYPSGRNV